MAREYEALKLSLWKKYEHNRDAYTDAKTDFIRHWTQEARKTYGNRSYPYPEILLLDNLMCIRLPFNLTTIGFSFAVERRVEILKMIEEHMDVFISNHCSGLRQ